MAETTIHESGIYEIINVSNGKRYIGSAANFRLRFNIHLSLLNRGLHHSRPLQRAWLKYGRDAFVFRKVILCSAADLLIYEQIALDAFRPEYNMLKYAGSTRGRIMTTETRAKIAAKKIGMKYSPEVIARRSAARRGRKLSPAHRATLLGNKHALGHKHTDEWKAAASARMTGMKRPKSPEYRAKIAASLKGIPHSLERRAKQAAGQRGLKRGPYKPWTAEAKRNHVIGNAIAIEKRKAKRRTAG